MRKERSLYDLCSGCFDGQSLPLAMQHPWKRFEFAIVDHSKIVTMVSLIRHTIIFIPMLNHEVDIIAVFECETPDQGFSASLLFHSPSTAVLPAIRTLA